MAECSFSGCDRRAHSRGFCNAHYNQWWNGRELKPLNAGPSTMVCERCGKEAERRTPMQKYCEPCSAESDRERKVAWARKNPQPKEQRLKNHRKRASKTKERGVEISREKKESIAWPVTRDIELQWISRVAIPFDYGFSKNAIWRTNRQGHVYLRREAKTLRQQLTWRLKESLQGMEVPQGKVWIDIFVQKPNHRGDAVNVIDLVCDAVKEAIPVDDNWYCIRRLDWEVAKYEPKLFVGVGQEVTEHHAVCNACGQIKTLDDFPKNRNNRMGIGRTCSECRKVAS